MPIVSGSRHYFDWTPERTEQLRTLLAEGKTASEAGAALGVTRNTVMGKAHRKGFPMNAPNDGGIRARTGGVRAKAERKNPIVPRASSYRKASNVLFTPKSPPKPQPVQRPSHAAPSLRLTLLDIRDNDCHFIEGDDHRYCGHPTEYLQSYCPAHCRVVWQPVRARMP